ncbi:MucR family transcriptional regulator [uncultured Rhodoblastus sp.]|uniref:MucR family transcriptional regulator n=1 Tax=uncultured Rhodoblastus sp. TaxID=543037 RepID=UPI0025D6B93D|nr:MucR family transcriptional regulator [uncultured Rhodoblastus sp.]
MSENDNTSLVAEVLSAYLSNNTVTPADLSSVIETVKSAFGVSVGATPAPAVDEPKKLEPAVSIKKSVTPDAIICLQCGKPFKSLKRHLQTGHGLSPNEYRAAFGLKSDYPIVAPNYAAQRSSLALSAGLGRKGAEARATKKVAVKKPGGKKPSAKAAAE